MTATGSQNLTAMDLHKRLPFRWATPLQGQKISSSQVNELFRGDVAGYTRFTFTFQMTSAGSAANPKANMPLRFQILTTTARLTKLLRSFTAAPVFDNPLIPIEGAFEQLVVTCATIVEVPASDSTFAASFVKIGVLGLP